jgi:hypothetical protein
MSFLSGILSAGKTAITFLKSKSVASTLLKTAIIGYAMSRLSKGVNRENNSGTQNIDKGVRLQLKPNAENKIPVLYGRAFFGGDITDAAMTNNNKTMWYCLTLSEKTGTRLSDSSGSTYTFHDVYLNQQRVVFKANGITVDYTVDREGTIDRNASGLINIYFYAGSRTAGISPSGYSASVPNAETLFPNWTSGANSMNNLIFALVKVDYNREKNITGLPEMLFEVENSTKLPGDVVYDYLTSTVYGAGIRDADIDNSSLTTLNTYSDSTFGYIEEDSTAQTLADRYQINGLIDTNEKVIKNAEQILSAAASWLSYNVHTGTWSAVINRTGSSVASFTDDNVLGSVAVSGTGLQDLYNAVQVNFPHRELRDSADFIKIEIPDADRNANEEDNTLNLTYDNINEPVQAELLGFIELKQSRVDLVVRFQTDYSYINLNAGDIIDLTNSRLGFSAKLFRIIAITEKQGNDGALTLDITALEYDADVYNTGDITRFTRTDEDGIITLGAIGTPGTPQITKYEQSNRPRIEVETTAPTGVVEGLEFWITFDDEEAVDANRSYTLVGTKLPVGGGVYTSGTTVVFEYDNLSESDFLFKTRGFNTNTVGPFSSPSGLVEFVPEQVPDAVNPDTAILDSTGGLATALTIIELLKLLDDLLGGSNAEGGIFKKIFDIFQTQTGVDILGDAEGGSLIVSSPITVKDEGTTISSDIAQINFTGAGVSATADGSNITVNIPGTGGNGGGGGEPEPEPEPDPLDPVVSPTGLNFSAFYPPDRLTFESGVSTTSPNLAPRTGSYFIKFSLSSGSFYAPLNEGTGTASLYKSDGTLVSQITANNIIIDNNVVEIPFPARDLGTDYYILLSAGYVNYCGLDSPAIISPFTWNFNTPQYDTAEFNIAGDAFPTVSINLLASISTCNPILTITANNNDISAGSGNMTITGEDSVVAYTLAASAFTIVDNVMIYPADSSTLSLNDGETYTINIPANWITAPGDPCGLGSSGGNNAYSAQITRRQPLALQQYELNSGFQDYGDSTLEINVSIQSNIKLIFNQGFSIGSGSFHIYKSNGTLHQSIDVETNFDDDGTSELIRTTVDNGIVLNPTVDMERNTSYYLLADAGTVVDVCGNNWAGISSTSGVVWTTDEGPGYTATPIDALGSIGPYGATGSVNAGGININTDRDVSGGPGNIIIRAADSTVVATIPGDSVNITYGEE